MSRPRRRGRDVHGVLLLDKPRRIQQRRAAKVKRIYNANRAGHTGALDPATGMLPICPGRQQSFQYLLDSDKRYRVIAAGPAHGHLRCRWSGGGRASCDV